MNDTPTPRSKIILDHIKIYVEADNAAQSYAHYAEVNREIESMERELIAVTEQRDRLAEAMRKIQKVGLVAVDAFDELDRIDEIVDEALAAVKGGADE